MPRRKPAAAKPRAPAAKKAARPRALPPLEKITDPRDLAEALRQAGAKKTKEVAAKAADASARQAGRRGQASQAAVGPAQARQERCGRRRRPAGQTDRRGFMISSLFISWIVVGWTAFTAGCVALTGMLRPVHVP